MGGLKDLYRETLEAYIVECGSLQRQVRDVLTAGDMESARRIVHSFKGLSATVGVAELHRLAQRAEGFLKLGQDRDALDQALAELVGAIEALTPVLRALCGELGAPDPVRPSRDSGIAMQFGTLLGLLRAQDLEALELHAQLRKDSDPPLLAAMDALDNAIAGLNFGAAEAECAKLINQFNLH
jgi:HPt (histidine-containing phosphotransfer) domain-containing protein